MNENFLIPNQSSLYNIKAIYNTLIEKLSEGGFENIIINPELNLLSKDNMGNNVQAGWEFNGPDIEHFYGRFLGTGDYIRQDIFPKLRTDEVYTVVLDLKISEPVRFAIEGQIIAPQVYAPKITDINYDDPADYQQNLIRVLEPEFDEFGHPKRIQFSFNFKFDEINYSSYTPAFLSFMKDITATNDAHIILFNVSVVKGMFGVSLSKRQGFFTDYVRYNTTGTGYYEASMDDGTTYHRILTTREEDIDDFVDILVTNDIIYTKNDCDLMFLRKDIPDAAERLITFLEGLKADQDINLDEAAKLVLDGGNIVVNNNQQSGTPSRFFSLIVKRGDERDVGIRYNESIDRWQFTHDGIDWKILGTGGSNGDTTGTGSSELEYYAEILNRTPYKWGYYDLFDEIDQGDSVITQNLNYSGDDTLYKVQDYPVGPWYVTTRNIWNPEHAGNTYGFFVHTLTNKHNNAGLSISYSLVGSGGGDPLLPTDSGWVPIQMNEIVSPSVPIDEMYLKFEFDDDTVEFHSFGVFYGVWDYSSSTYTRLREYYVSPGTDQTILVPNGGEYSVGERALELYLNRVRQILGVDYTEVDSTHVQMLVPVNPGDVIEFYEKFAYADFSEDNSIIINDHINDSSIHCDCSNINTRLTTVETWQNNFTELDADALAALSTHISDTTDAHDASAISVVSSSIDNSNATELQTLASDFDSAITTSNYGLGKNQLWQDQTTNRAINTVYSNSTPEPIAIKIDPNITEAGTLVLQVSEDNNTYVSMPGFDSIIPSNHYYKLVDTSSTTPATITLWVELRHAELPT